MDWTEPGKLSKRPLYGMGYSLYGIAYQVKIKYYSYSNRHDGLKAWKGGEEMYISNSAAFNMRIKVTIFTRPLKGSSETEVSSQTNVNQLN